MNWRLYPIRRKPASYTVDPSKSEPKPQKVDEKKKTKKTKSR